MLFNEFQDTYRVKANEQQKAALTKVSGPVLLLAVPGSGKTTVIVNRVGYMIHCQGISPSNILTLTFTVEAARQMADRFMDRFGADIVDKPHFSTIHSFCLSVINRSRSRYGIAPPELEPDNSFLIRKAYTAITHEFAGDNTIKELTQKLTFAKNMMYGDAEISEIECSEINFLKFYKKYESIKKAGDRMDFDDQLILAHKMLQSHPELLQEYQGQHRYISVDEAQDTSYVQHKIIEMLAAAHRNIFMVGDEDQSIYGFRAAYPDALTGFRTTYPDAEILYMETNYRSTGEIVKKAGGFITQNTERYPKNMKTENPAGDGISHTVVNDAGLQYRHLMEQLRKDMDGKHTTAVLYRNNESALPLLDLLEKNNIPFRYKEGGGEAFFGHFVVSDIVALLRLSQDPGDLDAYTKVYYKLSAYLSKQSVELLKIKRRVKKKLNLFAVLAEQPEYARQKKRLDEIESSLKHIRGRKPYEAIQGIMYELRYSEWMDRMRGDGYSELGMRQKLDTLLAVSQEYSTIPIFLARLEYLSGYKGSSEKCDLTLATIHASKGLEFDNVIIIDAYEGILPSERAVKDRKSGNHKSYEEEVRLFYVAATRARSKLEILTAKTRFGKSLVGSPFVDQLLGLKKAEPLKPVKPAEPLAADFKSEKLKLNNPMPPGAERYKPGKKVSHHKYGDGFIVRVEGNVLSIMFGQEKIRQFDLIRCIEDGLIKLA